jgi:hypothetical protein
MRYAMMRMRNALCEHFEALQKATLLMRLKCV